MRKLLVLSLCGLMLAACSDVASTPTATPVPFGRGESPQLAIMAPGIAEPLRGQAWAQDGSEETEQLLREIAGAQLPRPNLGQERIADMTRLIEILGEQPWYRDGLDINEKVGLAGLFRTYNSLLSGSRNPITGQQEFAFDGEYDFSALYFSAIEDKRFSVTRPGENWLTFVALGDVADEKTAEEALEYAKTYINPVTQFAGVISAPTVVLIIEPELGPCGTADEQRYLIRLRPDCMSPVLVIHEMTHLATPFILETWFEEGSAYWLSLHLTNQWGRPSILDLLKENPAPPFDSNCCIGEPGGHTAAANGGMFFFYELEKIIGPDAVGKAIKAIPSDLRQDTLAAILRATPPQHQAAVRNLITARCRNTVRGVVVSCAIPNVGPR